jgi:hypothetical protein
MTRLIQYAVPSTPQQRGTLRDFSHELLSRLLRGKRRGIEPPSGTAEIAPDVGVEFVIAVECKPLNRVSRRVTVTAHFDAGRARTTSRTGRDNNSASSRSNIGRSCTTASKNTVNPKSNEVVRQRAQVASAQLVLPRCLVSRLAHEPDAPSKDHAVHVVALDQSRAGHQTGRESPNRGLPRPRHARQDDTTGQVHAHRMPVLVLPDVQAPGRAATPAWMGRPVAEVVEADATGYSVNARSAARYPNQPRLTVGASLGPPARALAPTHGHIPSAQLMLGRRSGRIASVAAALTAEIGRDRVDALGCMDLDVPMPADPASQRLGHGTPLSRCRAHTAGSRVGRPRVNGTSMWHIRCLAG